MRDLLNAVLGISIVLLIGALLSRFAGFIGSKIFRFTDIYKYLLKFFKKHKSR